MKEFFNVKGRPGERFVSTRYHAAECERRLVPLRDSHATTVRLMNDLRLRCVEQEVEISSLKEKLCLAEFALRTRGFSLLATPTCDGSCGGTDLGDCSHPR